MAIQDVSIQLESKDRYLTYALSVVSGRALPDIRDGLKPVQRRILFAMLNNLNLSPDHSHRKSAAVVGEVLARFHPHGDIACYEAMVRMAQDFSLRYPLVDGQGNFGSLDGDSAAAYRYTEAKLRPIALDVIGEIYEETVLFRDNFDATVTEPTVLPSKVPNLLINGASGIAVGMATSIPPHNLREVVDALLELSEQPDTTDGRLVTLVKGPDFPTGCQILNSRKEMEEIYRTGKGAVRMRSGWKVEDGSRGKRFIVVESIPYAVNKSSLVEKIADLIVQRKLPQLTDVRDESTDEVRIVLELGSGADPETAMAYLFRHTPLESNFPVNLTALVPVKGSSALRPEVLSLRSMLTHFLEFREAIVEKRLLFEKKKLLERVHILEGLVAIYDALDEALKIVRKSDGRSDAAEKLRARFKLSEIQAFAVVDMRIYQLSRTTIDEIRAELAEKMKRIGEIDKLLKSKQKIQELVRRELKEISEKYGDKRRCSFLRDNAELEYKAEAYVVQEDVFAIITRDGWIKRIRQANDPTTTRLREGDAILSAHAVSTLDSVAMFTSAGNLFIARAVELPASGGYGDPVQKIFKFSDGESIVATFAVRASPPSQQQLVPVDDGLEANDTVVLASKTGTGFGLTLEDLTATKKSGRRVMKLRDGDSLRVVVRKGPRYAFFTRKACGLVIDDKEVPVRDSAAVGVSLISVRDDDELIGAVALKGGGGEVLLQLDGAREKAVAVKEITAGHRALKGTKVVARGEIEKVIGHKA